MNIGFGEKSKKLAMMDFNACYREIKGQIA